MHVSVMDFLKAHLSVEEIAGKKVVEIGSQDVNGTPRPVVIPFKPEVYIGVDFAPGPGVDVVASALTLRDRFGEGSFDVVISTEMLEHVEDWRPIVEQLKAIVKTGGLLLVTTRSPGFPYHPYPIDVWRYTLSDFREIFRDMEILAVCSDWQAPGVFIKARKPEKFVACDLSKIELARVKP